MSRTPRTLRIGKKRRKYISGTAFFALYDDCVLYIVPGTNGAPAMLYAADFDGNVQMQMKYDGSRIIIPDTYEKKLYLVDLDSLTAESVEF